jgi:hypothetical protein
MGYCGSVGVIEKMAMRDEDEGDKRKVERST